MRLNGKVAIVTGGGSGFGAGIVRKFVAEGAQVLVADLKGAREVAEPPARRGASSTSRSPPTCAR